MIGSFLFGLVGLAAYGLIAKLVMATLGAVVLLFIASRLR
ncbi:GlsB/YeaQ/YmgE family stress response membrane protein [Rhodothalassium salexigens]|nr:GlsB/YeaQ/YmgE family stress response membrane protein [Rhodothalassium salexigens]